jgi:tetratricopeptide (TPR) repeat protein
MKKFLIKIAIAAVFFSSIVIMDGCKKSKLDLLPGGPTEIDFFTKEADFNQAVLGVYAKMTDFFWYNGGQFSTPMPVFLLPGDDITTNNTSEEFEHFGPINPGSGRLGYLYSRHYQLINRANTLLSKINGPESSVYKTPNLQNYHKGEAHFLRGYALYNLWNLFGTAPFDTVRVTSSDQFFPGGTTGTQLLDQAIQDFTVAATLLPQTWNSANLGRVTMNSANGMLGKSLVFRASATKNAADYTAAIAAFNKITGANLTPVFGDNFAFDTENNEEALFEFQASQAQGGDNVWLDNDFDNPIGSLSVYWGYYDNNYSLFNVSRFYVTEKVATTFEAGDPRITSTFDPADRTVRKYVERNQNNQPGAASVNNYRILRYADVLLLKAEALLQSGGSTTEAISLINQVRGRARAMANSGVPADRAVGESDRIKIMDWIIAERLIELAGEGQRWFDLRRWQLQGIINLNNAFFSSNTAANMSFQLPKHLNFAIPNSETDINPNVIQNPGY